MWYFQKILFQIKIQVSIYKRTNDMKNLIMYIQTAVPEEGQAGRAWRGGASKSGEGRGGAGQGGGDSPRAHP